ncbi:MAG: dienelactone hydrolase family protein [Verrucomicrobiae bacterium]|nr:dienelactone hydrolase family protein [Verrucomicrobiae bacterium]
MKFLILSLLLCATLCPATIHAQAKTKVSSYSFDYSIEGKPYEGYIARPVSKDIKPRPAILVVHDWKGLRAPARQFAEELATMGYIALAVDMYGSGLRAETAEEAKKLVTPVYSDRTLMRQRIRKAYDELVRLPGVDPDRIAVLGFCFGGTVSLELARTGTPLRGAISFHGSLNTPRPADAANIKCPILILHGAADPLVPAAEVEAFKKEMEAAKIPYTFIAYPDAVHAFTSREAGNDPPKGAAYQEAADQKSRMEMRKFLEKVMR